MKKVLIIGGTSSLAQPIISKLENNGYEIAAMTFRQVDKIYNNYTWIKLDLYDKHSIEMFFTFLPKHFYSKIIFLSGSGLGRSYKDVAEDEMISFYDAFLINYISLIMNLTHMLEFDGQIVFISSIAADIPIQDAHYSAVKAGVEAFVRSASSQLSDNQSMFSISPATITDSMREDIANLILDADTSYNGKTIDIK
jgi:NADP-dependent 3-hydroxy acid dehydrogenase YdfG